MRTAAQSLPERTAAGAGRRRWRLTAGVAGLVAAALCGSALAVPAQAATDKYPRLAIVAASDQFLVFRQKVATPGGLLYTEGSRLFSIGRSGKRHAIKDFDPELFPAVSGSTLTQSARPNSRYDPDRRYDPAAPKHVRWRDLRSGATGVNEIPAGDDYVGAAPGGWIATRTEADGSLRVLRSRTDGSTTDLGSPFAKGVPWDLRPGTSGLLAVSAKEPDRYSEEGTVGAVRYQPYSTPGRWRTIYAPGPDAKISCGAPSSTHVLCESSSSATTHQGQVLLPLRDGTRRWLDAHPRRCPTATFRTVGSSAFAKASTDEGRCVKGRIEQLSAKGVLTVSKRTYGGRGDFLAGLGGFLFVSADQRTILRVTKATSTPKVVTRAR